MKIPTYEEVHTSNNYFLWFFVYSMFDALVFIVKWFFILFFLYFLFANMGIEGKFYLENENTKNESINFLFTIKTNTNERTTQ